MANFNKVILMGNLTRDPEVRYLPSGKAVADLGLAISSRYRTQDGEQKEEGCFVNCSVFGKQAENCGQYLSKGRQVLIEGRLHFEQWEKDGQKRSALKVIGDRVQFMGGGRGPDAGGEGAAPKPAPRREAAALAPEPAPEPSEAAAADEDNLPF